MVMGELMQETDVLVIGSGPGGYSAAFRAADLGLDVTMVDTAPRPGGECLFRGCIPSKTLLYMAELIHDAERAKEMGVAFGAPVVDLESLRSWKEKVIDTLAGGLVTLSEKRGVQLLQGRALFEAPDRVRLFDSDVSHIKFRRAVLATGSRPTPFLDADFSAGGRIMDASGALSLADIPETLLVLGGGYVALELGSVYAALGSRVTIAVRSDRLLRGADSDLAAPLIRRLENSFENILFNSQPAALSDDDTGVDITWSDDEIERPARFDRVLVAVGRQPNSADLGLEYTGVEVDERGFVKVDEQQRTADEHILAIGDVAGGPMLAHKAFHEGKVAAEVISGQPSAFDARAIPAIVYTDPQVAWAGLTEAQAEKEGRTVKIERYPWKFSSRAVTMGATDGVTKILIEPETGRILGLGITGRHTEGMISEGVLAIEMGALAQDLALSVHPHPTLSETVGEAAEIFLGSVTHMLPKKS
ncbi:MAG: dihydrolipoyl dehydrogenase [Deltaproteobacteria bacterium]|nr:dihydrolipoyl dehydrogenase [Deltaproteobacteria bacterium]